jgi:hypothetical protein
MSVVKEKRIVEIEDLVMLWDEDTEAGDETGEEAISFSFDNGTGDVGVDWYGKGDALTLSQEEVGALHQLLAKALYAAGPPDTTGDTLVLVDDISKKESLIACNPLPDRVQFDLFGTAQEEGTISLHRHEVKALRDYLNKVLGE